MKVLSLLCMAGLAMFLFACQKKNIESETTGKKEQQVPHKVNYFSLPPGGEHVNLQFANGKKLSFYKSDTMYLLEGDIVLTPHQVEQLKLINANNARTYTTNVAKHWTWGIIPYTFNANLTTASRNTILAAMNDWEAMAASLDFVPRTSQGNYIEFNANTENNSHIGMTGGKQIINLVQDATWGVDLTSTTHEIGHSLGLFHEQSRSDRDNFININWNNIKDNMEHNFHTYIQQGIPGTQFGTFDFNSIMLYPSVITDPNFVFNTGIATLTRLDGTTWGWNFWLSTGDAETAATLYGPPYARLENEITSYTYDPMGESFDEWGAIYIRFYSDPACTTPFTLTTGKSVTITDYIQTYQSGGPGYNYYNATYNYNLPAGADRYYLIDYHAFLDSYLGIHNAYEYHSFNLLNGYRR